jgi:hypothetical protein
MYRTYKRIRWEAERLDRLFPETRASHRRDGIRRNDWNQFSRASTSERWLWRVFHAALVVCALRYEVERFFYQNLAWSRPNSWDTVVESKWPLPSLPVQAQGVSEGGG